MKDINQKARDTDKRKTIALRRSFWLGYVLSLGAISAGWLSLFSVAPVLGTKAAEANLKEQSASLQDRTVVEEQALSPSSGSREYTSPVSSHQDRVNGESAQTTKGDGKTSADITSSRDTLDRHNDKILDAKEAGVAKAETSDTTTTARSAIESSASLSLRRDSCKKDEAESEATDEINRSCTKKPRQASLAPTNRSIAQLPDFTAKVPSQVETFPQNDSTDLKFGPPVLSRSQPTTATAVKATVSDNPSSSVSTKTTSDTSNLLARVPAGEPPTTAKSEEAPSSTKITPALNSVEGNVPKQFAVGNEPTTVKSAKAPSPSEESPRVYRGRGGASLLGGTIQAQSSFGNREEPASPSENARQLINPLAPTLRLQGVYVYQDESSARARLIGIYPISPNALFGGTLDLTAGNDFANAPGGGVQLQFNELYFTGSLPSMPNLRMTVGLIDLTSYFDRNSFAKNEETHFFNSVFQTNPALAAAGIGSRPGILFNWDITDNFQARAAAFSSHRNLGDFALDAYAGELAFRAGNAIVRGTFASDRDAGRNNGFKEIYGLPRSDGGFGIRSGDRENAYGINAEYYIPEIKMGLFGRYGRYDNTSVGKGGDTYSLGLNFLDLFMKDDRLGFGYGRDLSNDDLRRTTKAKVPDVWELFYDFLISPNLRAGVTLQAREQFSDFVAGFRVKTEFDLLGRLFR
jgi:hypothetical protein